MAYNGHKSRGHWNVALWIGNDEGLYRLALDCLACSPKRPLLTRYAEAAQHFIDAVGATRTPDGVPYHPAYVIAALRGLEE